MRLALVAVVTMLAGCQGGITVDASADSFCDEEAKVVCHNIYQCCTESQIEDALNVSDPRTEEECRSDVTRACDRQEASLRDSLKAGRVKFDSDAANTCLQSFVAPDDTCSEYVMKLPWTDACEKQIWVGTVATDGQCFFSHDCAGAPKSATCGSNQKCVALPGAGFPCPADICADGFFCNDTQICEAKLAEGAACTGADQCDKNLFCDLSATSPVCTSKKGAGEACTSNQGCVSSSCVPGKCAGTSQNCYTDDGCGGHCANSTFSCTVGMDYSCNSTAGHCDVVTSQPCSGFSADSECTSASAGTKCIFNVSCVPGDCVGDPVCTAALVVTDYCEAGLGLTP